MLWHLRGSSHHLVDEANDLLILMNLRGNERFNLTATYLVHEVCMRESRVTSLIGQFFLIETYILFRAVDINLENIIFRWGWLPIMPMKDLIYSKLV